MRQLPCAAPRAVVFLAIPFLLVTCFAQPGFAQQVPPTIFKNYFVTGDYVVGGWVETSSSGGFATGTISIPDCKQALAMAPKQPCPAPPIPLGADIVAAYLYWGTVEGNQTTFVGQQAVFNGYKIIGTVLGNPNAPTSWSSGGCTGSSTGSKTMRIYRADVRPYLPLDLNSADPTFGAILTRYGTSANNPAIQVSIADSGSNGNTQPNALGATLVLIWRDLSPSKPRLNAIVLYDGSYAPSNGNPTMTDNIVGFYQPAESGRVAKLTQIVANGQPNKGENVYFGPTPPNETQLPGPLGVLPPLYPAYTTPFPGLYGGFWDNPTWTAGLLAGKPVSLSTLMDVAHPGTDSQTLYVAPTATNSGCVNWGAMVLSTTVQDRDGDGLLDAWEDDHGYYDVAHVDPKTGQVPFVALPGANSGTKDLFVEVDYLALRDPNNPDPKTNILHSHLPKQAALDAIAAAFANNNVDGINMHFDLPAGIYSDDLHVISTGAGGKEIPESSLLCTDAAGALCAFPNQPAVSWKGDFEFVKQNSAFGNFQPGREQSYHYALFGHALGEARSYWGTANTSVAGQFPTAPQLVSIVVCNHTSGCTPGSTVTIQSPTLISSQGQLVPPQTPPLMLKPGDCTANNPPAACITDANDANEGGMPAPPIWNRVTVSGSLTTYLIPPLTQLNQGLTPVPAAPPLNGTYNIIAGSVSTGSADPNGMVTTILQIPVSNPHVPDGTYQFSCPPPGAPQPTPPCIAEPQLGVSYLGPTSTSGHADFAGGDVAVTLGLWGADNAAGCQHDPSQPATGTPPAYCDDQVGTLKVQTGTLMHELGHTLKLAHGGVYYPSTFNGVPYPSVPTFELNCRPNYLSVMSYLFQVRGFVDGTVDGDPQQHKNQFDYSGQLLPPLNETTAAANAPTYSQQFGASANALSESAGLGSDQFSQPAEHLTRWYSFPNAADSPSNLNDLAKAHCDGTPFVAGEQSEVRVDGMLPPPLGGNFSAPLDWNNDLVVPNDVAKQSGTSGQQAAYSAGGVDLNHNGFFTDAPFSGFDDWASIDLQQMNGRAGLFGFSEGGLGAAGGGGLGAAGGGGLGAAGGGGTDSNGAGGLGAAGGGGLGAAGGGGLGAAGGGGLGAAGGGGEQNTETANSTADAPTNLNCNTPPTGVTVTVPLCTGSSEPFTEKSKSVPLFWSHPDFGQIMSYSVWRALGSFTTVQQVRANISKFTNLKTFSGTPPSPFYFDSANLQSGKTYTYFVTDSNKFGANSGPSVPLVILVKF